MIIMSQYKELKLSPSKLNMFAACPRCFWFSMHKKKFPAGLPMFLNNMMDLIEKNYYDKHRKEGLPPLLKGKVPCKLVDEKLAQRVRKYITWTDKETGAVLRGKMDDCFLEENGALAVMDNKTLSGELKEIREGYKLQLDCYAFLLEKNGYKVSNNGYLIYFIPDKTGDPENGVKFSAEVKYLKIDTTRALKIFREAVRIARLRKAPAHHAKCATCLWVKEILKE